jgi:hypothetical protein
MQGLYGLGIGGVQVAFTITTIFGEQFVFFSRTLVKPLAQIPVVAIKWCLEPQ